MKRNSILSFLKEKSFIIVLALTLTAAGTMAALSAFSGKNEPQDSQIAQQDETAEKTPAVTESPEGTTEPAEENHTGEPASEDTERKISDIALGETYEGASIAGLNPQAELEDQFVEASELEEASADNAVAEGFQEAGAFSLQWPVQGEVLMEFAMDHSIYFETLAQYQYNPAMIIGAAEGTAVLAAASGTVIESAFSNEIGNYVTMDLGDGFMLTYGQLADVTREVGEVVNTGESIGVISKPTRSYTAEGSNLYLKLTKDGTAVDPAEYLE